MQRTIVLLKKGWTIHPGGRNATRGCKNAAWNPKWTDTRKALFLHTRFQYPKIRPATWQPREFERVGHVEWPKAVGFWNAGDNWELTPEMHWRLFLRNKDEPWWTKQNNEQTIVHLMPLVEKAPAEHLPRVDAVFQAHVTRFGNDHMISNAVMQAKAFARDMPGCLAVFENMSNQQLEPNAQSYVNLMLACKLCGLPKVQAEKYFTEGLRTGSLSAVMRPDTEFQMWWDQLNRMGSFTAEEGFLSNQEEGSKPRPSDMFASIGWGQQERKHLTLQERVRQQKALASPLRSHTVGTVMTNVRREPWSKYQGYRKQEFVGPTADRGRREQLAAMFADAPPPETSKRN